MKCKVNQTSSEEEEEFSDSIETKQEETIGNIDYLIQAATMKIQATSVIYHCHIRNKSLKKYRPASIS